MSDTSVLLLLLLTPLCIALLNFICRLAGDGARTLTTALHSIGILAILAESLWVVTLIYQQGDILVAGKWLHLDSLSALFLAILGIISFITGLYSIGYMRHEVDEGEVSVAGLCNYYGFFHLFIFTMLLVITSNNLIMMWAAIEATTLSSAFLVGTYSQRSSLEAAWKYIIICSVGVAFGLFGTILVYANAASIMPDPQNAIFWTEVLKHASELDTTLMQLAFVFVLIGFGTKTGLFPMHAWLPDAHSEAPSPVSALLSAVLLNCALLIIIRYNIIIRQAIGPHFTSTLLVVFGMLSVAVAAFFILVQRDIKRLLAYSSVENMGLIAVALGIGGPLGILAAMLHTLNHSLAKALLFCGSGNVLLKYGTRDISVAKGMLKVMPFSAVLLAGGALGLGGMPPFNVFLSEFMTVIAGLSAGHIGLTIVLLLLLTIVLGGLVRMIAAVLFGNAPEPVSKGELGILTTLPMAILLVLMLIMGTHIPQPVVHLLENAATVVLQQDKSTVSPHFNWPWAAGSETSVTTGHAAVNTPSGEKSELR
ncbi:hydrogenase 4 subunit F [Shimwellia blattae]|uniref:Hydrogenase-4 component F n=1 Tax=Shimwellia blattae (strain ATCC 29907 / DSM 4481 / JCM 1650 / NBRC 105725 / CDC 9005-74) TaxID=630626 RepID=I2BDA9_SHIBC|nr:hydrogenase 4 subunit F [Shimwellia blattae]AFJ48513.1 hydrogenase-4 component F [Shimwellia blattae DSM 4481 = NBRC 105725]GAB83107.1 NiFe-hydrogenase 4 component F [Shimwellia blattae DSM 4481 = NBRC 105725]VDY66005.1 Hydrogenase-4 component B [Shimwellia blattae]VEC26610.1 Hydrogenase-4 component B [Shimwellia blattae]